MTDKQRTLIEGMDLFLRKIIKHSDDTEFTVRELIELSNETYNEILDGQ